MPKRASSPVSQRTRTSPFGAPGGVSHDAAPFYASRLYEALPKGQAQEDGETPIPPAVIDSIHCRSAEQMTELPNASVHLMVTSPPYNVGKDYDVDLTLNESLDFLTRVWQEVYRVLVPGGRVCVNVANLGRKPYTPLHALILENLFKLGFLMRGEIIWNKAASASPSTAWGSWQSAANPTLRDVHEYILVFSKGSFSHQNPNQRANIIGRDEFLEYTKSVWSFPSEPARKVGHPAPFPVELPRRLIQLYSFEGEVVLDPFMGSGQTALAALQTHRHFIGYETNLAYVKLAEDRTARHSRSSPPSE